MPKLDKEQYSQVEVEELIRKSEEAQTEALEVAKLEAAMSDAEKGIYKSLEGEAKSEFLFASASERAAHVAKAADSDPIVFTASNGDVFRKSDDARLVKMAKERDEERKEFLKLAADRANEVFVKRAETELEFLPGTVETRAAILKAVEGIADADMRKAAFESLKAKNAAMSKSFSVVGTTAVKKDAGAKAADELDSLAKAHQAKNPTVNYYDAYDAVSRANPDLTLRAVQEG